MENKMLRFMKLSDNAIAPIRGTPSSAGLDLASSHDVVIEKRSRGIVYTDIRILLPKNCYGRIADRSGCGGCMRSRLYGGFVGCTF